MPFGLRNAAQTFQWFMDQVLRGVTSAYAYINDVLIAIEQHLKDLRTVFNCLSSHGIIINPNKCIFGVPELDFLGHHIVSWYHPSPRESSGHQRLSLTLISVSTTSVHRTCEFLSPFSSALCRNDATPACSTLNKIPETDSAVAAFNAPKEALANAALLSYPQPVTSSCLMSDASDTAVSAVLQHVNGTWHPISFFTRKMTPAETRYMQHLRQGTVS